MALDTRKILFGSPPISHSLAVNTCTPVRDTLRVATSTQPPGIFHLYRRAIREVQQIALIPLMAVQAPKITVLDLDILVLVEFTFATICGLVFVTIVARKVFIIDGWRRNELSLFVSREWATWIRSRVAELRRLGFDELKFTGRFDSAGAEQGHGDDGQDERHST